RAPRNLEQEHSLTDVSHVSNRDEFTLEAPPGHDILDTKGPVASNAITSAAGACVPARIGIAIAPGTSAATRPIGTTVPRAHSTAIAPTPPEVTPRSSANGAGDRATRSEDKDNAVAI